MTSPRTTGGGEVPPPGTTTSGGAVPPPFPPGGEVVSPYRTTASAPSGQEPTTPVKRVRIPQLRVMKERGERWPMLTAYDRYAAEIFDEAGIPVLLVGDSAANNVYGYDSTLPVTVDELLPLVRAVVRATRRALVVADLPFGSYQVSPAQALQTATRFMKEAGAHAVKLEGGRRFAPQVETLVGAGVPVMAHLGFTPQSEHTIGGYRVQGRGEAGEALVADALALQAAGAFAVVLEMVPADVAKRVTAELAIPTVGIGAGPDCDAQVLVWQDMAGMNRGRTPRFVKRYATLGDALLSSARAFGAEVRDGVYPDPEHSYT
jgi:3-methyl-2-oxobutanoate hydroxymethyltransferase